MTGPVLVTIKNTDYNDILVCALYYCVIKLVLCFLTMFYNFYDKLRIAQIQRFVLIIFGNLFKRIPPTSADLFVDIQSIDFLLA